MTEAEWLACADPTPMLEFLRGKSSERKLRLFACGCCRLVWHLLAGERSRKAVEAAESYADGRLSPDGLVAAYRASDALRHELTGVAITSFRQQGITTAALAVVHAESSEHAFLGEESDGGDDHEPRWCFRPHFGAAGAADCAAQARALTGRTVEASRATRADQAGLLRDLFGPLPFRPVTLAHSVLAWNDGSVRRIAEGIYQERQLPGGKLDTGRMNILADALLDAGCDNEELIAHCRSEGPHVRGCWAVDLILGNR